MRLIVSFARAGLLAAAAMTASVAAAQSAPSRGQLLYDTHCKACHTTQLHWREQRRASDWGSLVAQVRRWQGEARLNWTEDDVEAVARYLNDAIYRYKGPAAMASLN